MRVKFLIGLAAIAVSACGREPAAEEAAIGTAPDPQTSEEAPIAASGSIAAPVPEEVATVITEADADGTVSVHVGTTIAVALIGVPTAGYAWGVEEAPGFIEAAGETGGPTSTDQLQQGYAGGHHWEVFLFAVRSEGSGVLRLEQRRPWETDEPAIGAFSVTITATENG